MSRLIGIDVGTTGCKAVVFNPDGEILGHGFREYGIICDEPAKAEQDAETVWRLTMEAVREAAAKSGTREADAIGLSMQGDAIIPVAPGFRPLHNALLGMDYRPTKQAEACGRAPAPGCSSIAPACGLTPSTASSRRSG